MSKLLLIAPAMLLLSLTACTNNQAQTSVKPTTNVAVAAATPTSDVLYIDVREDDEWAAGHIAGALHVKLGDIESGKVDAIPKDRDVALYCRSGRRSAIAMTALQKLGYTRVRDAGGMTSVRGVSIVK